VEQSFAVSSPERRIAKETAVPLRSFASFESSIAVGEPICTQSGVFGNHPPPTGVVVGRAGHYSNAILKK
jgi:hypothetical protein